MSIISYSTPKIKQGLTSVCEGRFSGEAGKITRALNRIAIKEARGDVMHYTFPKATPEDLKRLTSTDLKDSYKRVTWTNPKDNKVYHILEEGRKEGKVQVRILDKDGEFVKNAELEPKNVVIFDNFFSPRGMTHGELVETFFKRHNPFANVERLEHKRGLFEFIKYRGQLPKHLELKRFDELEKQMEKGKKVDYISISIDSMADVSPVEDKPGQTQLNYLRKKYNLVHIAPIFESIMKKGARIFESAGNDRNASGLIADRLAMEGIEGVGSLVGGNVAKDSCSRNSIFTQHYERRDFLPHLVKNKDGKSEGINITGLPGTDLPLNWKTKKLNGRIVGGTSYSTPIRVAKISLNDMLEGIL